MGPLLLPLQLVIQQATDLQVKIQALLTANVSDVQELQAEFSKLQTAVAQTDTMLGALAATLANPK